MITRTLKILEEIEGNVLSVFIHGMRINLTFNKLDSKNKQLKFSFDNEKDVTEFIRELETLKKELYGK